MIKVKEIDGLISVSSPYDNEFIKRARQMGGTWNKNNKTWDFPVASKQVLLIALSEIYGYVDGAVPTITVRFNAIDFKDYDSCISIGKQLIARRPGRDYPVELMSESFLIGGKFSDSAGSARYPRVLDGDEDDDKIVIQSKITMDNYDSLSDDEKQKLVIVEDETTEKDSNVSIDDVLKYIKEDASKEDLTKISQILIDMQ